MSKTLFKKQQGRGFLSPLRNAILQLLLKRANRSMYLCSYCSLEFYSPESRESKFNNVTSNDKHGT